MGEGSHTICLTRVPSRSELILRCPAGADEQVDAEKSDDEQGRGVELQEVSMDVAEVHLLVHGNTYCHSREEECIETWRRTVSDIVKQLAHIYLVVKLLNSNLYKLHFKVFQSLSKQKLYSINIRNDSIKCIKTDH